MEAYILETSETATFEPHCCSLTRENEVEVQVGRNLQT